MKALSQQLPAFFLATLASSGACASGEIGIDNAWLAEAPPVSRVLAAYMDIENRSTQDRQAVAVQCEAFERAEFHRSVEQDGIARMQHLDRLEINAGSELKLAPGGYHLMLHNPARRLLAGDTTACSMAFDNGVSIRFELDVRKAAPADHSHHHHH